MPHILIVDDEVPQRTLIREMLAINPAFTFTEGDDGAQALKLARSVHPDLIIMDVMMPKMDGFQVCRILKSDPAMEHVPIIMVTALGHIEDQSTAINLGAFDFVTKPFNMDDLVAKVNGALAGER
jgi:DNA-binding response OmpR family regulator